MSRRTAWCSSWVWSVIHPRTGSLVELLRIDNLSFKEYIRIINFLYTFPQSLFKKRIRHADVCSNCGEGGDPFKWYNAPEFYHSSQTYQEKCWICFRIWIHHALISLVNSLLFTQSKKIRALEYYSINQEFICLWVIS